VFSLQDNHVKHANVSPIETRLGRIYTFYTPKYVFIIVVVLFEVGSAICGAAPTSTVFIIGRAVAGVGSAGLMSGAVVLMVEVVPLHKRPKYQGAFGAVFGIASTVGPLLGMDCLQ
jgi:MFS family permease